MPVCMPVCMLYLYVLFVCMYLRTPTFADVFNTFEFHYIVMCLFLEYGGLACHFCRKKPRGTLFREVCTTRLPCRVFG